MHEFTMRTTFIVLSLGCSLACGNQPKTDKGDDNAQANAVDKGDKGDKGDRGDKGDTKIAADGAIEIDIEKFGLKVDVPKGVKASDAVVGEGVMVNGPGLVLTIELAGKTTPKTLDEAKQEAEIYTPQNIQEQTLADGWTITFENKGGMGTNYWVQSRREIGQATYWCSSTAAQVEQQAHALTACTSLRK